MNRDAYRLAKQNNIFIVDYYELMMDNTDEVEEALKKIEKDKLRMTGAYTKRVMNNFFQVGEVVWMIFFPSWDEEQQVRQVVAMLTRSIQNCQGNLWKFIHSGDAAGRAFTQDS